MQGHQQVQITKKHVEQKAAKILFTKLQVVLKELKESLYWLRLIKKANLLTDSQLLLTELLQENKELTDIIAKSIVTAKIPK